MRSSSGILSEIATALHVQSQHRRSRRSSLRHVRARSRQQEAEPPGRRAAPPWTEDQLAALRQILDGSVEHAAPVRPLRSLIRSEEFTANDLAILAEQAPCVYRDMMANEPNWRRLAWANLIAQIIGHIFGLAALSILAATAWHAINLGAAAQGASIICVGAVSIVAVFVTGRLAN